MDIDPALLAREAELEQLALMDGAGAYRRDAADVTAREEGASLPAVQRWLRYWYPTLVLQVRHEQRQVRAGKADAHRNIFGPYILLCPADKMALVTLHEALSHCMASPAGVPMTRLAHAIGRSVMAEVMQSVYKGTPETREAYRKLAHMVRRITPEVVNRHAKRDLEEPRWEMQVRVQLGVRLLWLLIHSASAAPPDEEFRLAFHHRRRRQGRRTVGEIRLDEDVHRGIEDGHRAREYLRPRYMPMVVPPLPWTEGRGGYIRTPSPLVACASRWHRDVVMSDPMPEIRQAVDAISSVPWRVNRKVLDVMQRLWEQGGAVAGLPASDDRPMPPFPEGGEKPDIARWKKQARSVHRHNRSIRSERHALLSRLRAAECVAGDVIYLPHYLDFRGRVYAMPALNHQGDDVSRGLLEFADAVPVNDRGRWWLAVHLANCCGVDKVSFDDRVRWVAANADAIAQSAIDPLGCEWWMHQENPWQTLAACFAIADPADGAGARLPVQVDGSCNGLQHYAALMLDPLGAAAVGLERSNVPADIYTQVLDRVRPLVAMDADGGDEEAAALIGVLQRSLVKQPVMTSVYGVTRHGARRQIQDALGKAGVTVDSREAYRQALYLCGRVLDGIDRMCPAASAAMEWMRQQAAAVCDAYPKAGIEWVTPMGLRVVQPYRRDSLNRVDTIMSRIQLRMSSPDDPVRRGRQVRALPPNFIHSLDGEHWMRTAVRMRASGHSVAGVHDSYWSHANAADLLGDVLREEFVVIHEENRLDDLHQQLARRFPDAELSPPPSRGDFNIRRVLSSPYFFH